jgi:hypothetical protein
MQGLLAYYYDVHKKGRWMELNQCRFNHMGMDVRYRSPPNFYQKHSKVGWCRNNQKDGCEDCMVTPVSDVYQIHYTQCRKPWNCIGEANYNKSSPKMNIPIDSVHLDHCMMLQTVWHTTRRDLERQLQPLVAAWNASAVVDTSLQGTYKPDVFQGHCRDNGGDYYVGIPLHYFSFIRALYGDPDVS